ncbi:MAG: DUF4188 domain-containing protein [Microbacterium sp.]
MRRARSESGTRAAKGAVGVWHETYAVARAESIYVGMPPTGLGRATALKPVSGRLDRARARFDGGARYERRASGGRFGLETSSRSPILLPNSAVSARPPAP